MPKHDHQWRQYFITGIQFETLPGTYYLPISEGLYSVYTDNGESKILMRTNGSGTEYSHLNIAPKTTDVCVDYGWIRFFQWSGTSYNRNFHVIPAANQEHGYPQANYFTD